MLPTQIVYITILTSAFAGYFYIRDVFLGKTKPNIVSWFVWSLAPYYAWFIKRNAEGKRTHHIHMVEADSELWDRLYFRDYLRQFSAEAKHYDELKRMLVVEHSNDRVKYTEEKSDFILSLTKKAKEYYRLHNQRIT
jgi:GrpB-like predicted nucleotidyltransferase (UPF0157 family)